MTQCDMCGLDRSLTPALIEGTTLHVCQTCGRFGKLLPQPATHVTQQTATQKARQHADAEMDRTLVDDFAHLIKQAREHKGLQQKDLAQAVKEKESVIQHIESGRMHPSLDLAQKLEKFLHITLVQVYVPPTKLTSTQDGTLTIGDLVNIRKRS